MSHHILHLLSHHLRVRIRLDQLTITDTDNGSERTVPVRDIAAIIAAAPDLSVTAGALRRLAELNVILLICNERFEPCSLTLPYYRATNTDLLRRQITWDQDWMGEMWRQVIVSKIRNQAANLAHLQRPHSLLLAIADMCQKHASDRHHGPSQANSPLSVASVTASKRQAFLSGSPNACESRAARHYWKHLLPRLSKCQHTAETGRSPGTREGVNGMLDYGYAVLRTVVLRSLAVHGFIAAIGISHAPKAGSFALADDLMEPLRPWIDHQLRLFLQHGPKPMPEWIHQSVQILTTEVQVGRARVRLLNAVDLYVQSFADAALTRTILPLRIPMLA